jgi:hypothetical protein
VEQTACFDLGSKTAANDASADRRARAYPGPELCQSLGPAGTEMELALASGGSPGGRQKKTRDADWRTARLVEGFGLRVGQPRAATKRGRNAMVPVRPKKNRTTQPASRFVVANGFLYHFMPVRGQLQVPATTALKHQPDNDRAGSLRDFAIE